MPPRFLYVDWATLGQQAFCRNLNSLKRVSGFRRKSVRSRSILGLIRAGSSLDLLETSISSSSYLSLFIPSISFFWFLACSIVPCLPKLNEFHCILIQFRNYLHLFIIKSSLLLSSSSGRACPGAALFVYFFYDYSSASFCSLSRCTPTFLLHQQKQFISTRRLGVKLIVALHPKRSQNRNNHG